MTTRHITWHHKHRSSTKKKQFSKFSHYSVLSNLSYGVDTIETATQSQCSGGRYFNPNKENSERMLKVLTMLDEDDCRASILNH